MIRSYCATSSRCYCLIPPHASPRVRSIIHLAIFGARHRLFSLPSPSQLACRTLNAPDESSRTHSPCVRERRNASCYTLNREHTLPPRVLSRSSSSLGKPASSPIESNASCRRAPRCDANTLLVWQTLGTPATLGP